MHTHMHTHTHICENIIIAIQPPCGSFLCSLPTPPPPPSNPLYLTWLPPCWFFGMFSYAGLPPPPLLAVLRFMGMDMLLSSTDPEYKAASRLGSLYSIVLPFNRQEQCGGWSSVGHQCRHRLGRLECHWDSKTVQVGVPKKRWLTSTKR